MTENTIDMLMACNGFPHTKPSKAYREFARAIESAVLQRIGGRK